MHAVFWPRFELGTMRQHSSADITPPSAKGAQDCREVANETANCRRSRASISPGFKHNGIDP